MPTFDPNTWYQLTESRVNFTSALEASTNDTFFTSATRSQPAQSWQLPVTSSHSNPTYQLRSRGNGPYRQLSVCYVPTETDPSRTRPCFQPWSSDDTQKWEIISWGANEGGENETYYVRNVGNGSAYHLDVHPGNPVFMSSTVASEPVQPAQHWMMRSLGRVDDGAWSSTATTGTATATTTPTSTSQPRPIPTNNTNSSGISTGAKAGIGVGIAAVVILLIALLAFFLKRRRPTMPPPTPVEPTYMYTELKPAHAGHTQVHEQAHEMGVDNEATELDSRSVAPPVYPPRYGGTS